MKSNTPTTSSPKTNLTGPHRDQMYLLEIWLRSKNIENFRHLLEQDPRAMAATKRVRQHLEQKKRASAEDPESAEWMRSNPELAKAVVGRNLEEYTELEYVSKYSKPSEISSKVKIAVAAAVLAAVGTAGFFGTKAYFEHKYGQEDSAEQQKPEVQSSKNSGETDQNSSQK